jgi:hypothetical protein
MRQASQGGHGLVMPRVLKDKMAPPRLNVFESAPRVVVKVVHPNPFFKHIPYGWCIDNVATSGTRIRQLVDKGGKSLVGPPSSSKRSAAQTRFSRMSQTKSLHLSGVQFFQTIASTGERMDTCLKLTLVRRGARVGSEGGELPNNGVRVSSMRLTWEVNCQRLVNS